MTIPHRLDRLIAEVQDTLAAIQRAKAGLVVDQCACGCSTVTAPCPRCRRKNFGKPKTQKAKTA